VSLFQEQKECTHLLKEQKMMLANAKKIIMKFKEEEAKFSIFDADA
jgi:hypothetical protein